MGALIAASFCSSKHTKPPALNFSNLIAATKSEHTTPASSLVRMVMRARMVMRIGTSATNTPVAIQIQRTVAAIPISIGPGTGLPETAQGELRLPRTADLRPPMDGWKNQYAFFSNAKAKVGTGKAGSKIVEQ